MEQPTYRLFSPSPSTLLFYFTRRHIGVLPANTAIPMEQRQNIQLHSHFLSPSTTCLSFTLSCSAPHTQWRCCRPSESPSTYSCSRGISFCCRTTACRLLELCNSTQQNKLCTNRRKGVSSNSVLGGPGLRLQISVQLQQMKYE